MDSVSFRDIRRSFSGRRVFVTGHTGFKGSWLLSVLSEAGAEIMGYALRPATQPALFDLLELDHRVTHVVGDVRDGAKLASTLRDFQPEYVFHLAAQAFVKQSYVDPAATIDINVRGSMHLLEAVRLCESVRALVYVTSDKCYENLEWVWGYRENDRLGGHDPYSASKAAAEIVFASYASSFFSSRPTLGAATARAGNVIGGGDWSSDRIVPDCVRASQTGGVVELRQPQSTRPWQHVLEPVSGYLLLAASLYDSPEQFRGSWNFGPPASDVRTVYDVATTIMDRLGHGTVNATGDVHGHHEARLLQLNCDRAHQLLRWYPRWHVDRTLAATADWYRAVREGADPVETTRAQIRAYFGELS